MQNIIMKNFFENKYIDDIKGDFFNNYFTPIWNEVLKNFSFQSLLDVGCGNGFFSSALKKDITCKLYGIDANPYALTEASKVGFDEVQLVEDFSYNKIPFSDEQFSMILCKDVFEHLLNPEHLLQEMIRVANKNGRLLIHIPNHFSLYGRLKFLITNNIDTFDYFPESNSLNFPHIRFITHKDLSELFKRNGLIIEKDLSYFFFSFPLQRFLPYKHVIAKQLIKKAPSEFACGFTFLLKKQ